MTAWVREARLCPTMLNEIKKTKLKIYAEPQTGTNILLPPVPLLNIICPVLFYKIIHRFFECQTRLRPASWREMLRLNDQSAVIFFICLRK
jgi:hypothetical protein